MSVKEEKKADLATRESGALAELDSLFDEAGQEGLENIGSDEIVLPRLAILQPTSPLATEEGYRTGNLVNTITGENFGNAVEFFPLLFWSSRIHWVDPMQGGAIDCQARDGQHGSKKDEAHANGDCASCPFGNWTGDGEPPRCTIFKNVLLIPKTENPTPLVFSAKRTAIKPTNQFLSAAVVARRPNGKPLPFYGMSWTLESVKKQNDQGTFWVPKFNKGDIVGDSETFMKLRQLYNDMKQAQSKLVVQQDHEPAENGADLGATDY